MIVYVTGCLGFIGRYVTELLLENGFYVYVIDSCTYATDMSVLNNFISYEKFKFEKKNNFSKMINN